jgi:hypothetical protein
LNKEYNKPIDTDGVIDIYPNVKRRKYREENKKKNDSDCKVSPEQE